MGISKTWKYSLTEGIYLQSIIQKLNELGYQTIDGSWYDRVENWNKWYKGRVDKFHNYTVWNGQHKVKCERYTLGMGKKVCEDWANLLMNEKVKITLEGEKEQAFIDELFTRSDFEVNMNELQEKCAARGTYAVIPRVRGVRVNERGEVASGAGEIVMDYVTADRIYPLSWTGREITECAFATVIAVKEYKYIYLQIHAIENGNYYIENKAYRTSRQGGNIADASLADIPGFENVPERIYTGSDKRQFVIGRYNIANNIEEDNPMGIAVFANAIDILKACDIAYDSYVNEFVLGKKRVMVKPSVTKRMDGEDVFDPNDVTFYVLPEDIQDGAVVQPIDMSLRTSEHSQGLQEHLNQLSSKCGFGQRHYMFDQGGISTATQVISENSDMFRAIKKNEIVLESVIVELCRILLRMGNYYLSAGLNEDVEISIDFDDSIIIDKAQEEARVYQMLAAGLMRADEARSLLMNEDIDTARNALPNMEEMTQGETQDEVE